MTRFLKITRICPKCGKEFRPKHSGRGGTKTCSRRCGAASKEAINGKSCKNCGRHFFPKDRRQIFCGQSCAAKHNCNRKGTGKHKDNRDSQNHRNCKVSNVEGKVEKCVGCGAQLLKTGRKYCSPRCMGIKTKEESIDKWLSGRKKKCTKAATRIFLKRRDGEGCAICGTKEWNGKSIVLEIEHIDGNSENNVPENLKLLCPNCHSQTDTYKGKNRGRGRFERRKRYLEGKSY